MHDSSDTSSLIKIGKLPSGCDFIINRVTIKTDPLIAECFIESHFLQDFLEKEREYYLELYQLQPF